MAQFITQESRSGGLRPPRMPGLGFRAESSERVAQQLSLAASPLSRRAHVIKRSADSRWRQRRSMSFDQLLVQGPPQAPLHVGLELEDDEEVVCPEVVVTDAAGNSVCTSASAGGAIGGDDAMVMCATTSSCDDESRIGFVNSSDPVPAASAAASPSTVALEAAINNNELLQGAIELLDVWAASHESADYSTMDESTRQAVLSRMVQMVCSFLDMADCHRNLLHIAMTYLGRYLSRCQPPMARLRLFHALLVSVMLAVKMWRDEGVHARAVAVLFGLASADLARMERNFLLAIDFDLYVDADRPAAELVASPTLSRISIRAPICT